MHLLDVASPYTARAITIATAVSRNPALLEAYGFDILPSHKKPVAELKRNEKRDRWRSYGLRFKVAITMIRTVGIYRGF